MSVGSSRISRKPDTTTHTSTEYITTTSQQWLSFRKFQQFQQFVYLLDFIKLLQFLNNANYA